MRWTWKSLVTQAAVIVVALCLGATAMYAWQMRANSPDERTNAVRSSMFDVPRELHNNAHLDDLPIQVLENYN